MTPAQLTSTSTTSVCFAMSSYSFLQPALVPTSPCTLPSVWGGGGWDSRDDVPALCGLRLDELDGRVEDLGTAPRDEHLGAVGDIRVGDGWG